MGGVENGGFPLQENVYSLFGPPNARTIED